MTQDKIIHMARDVGAIKRYWGEGKEGFAFQTNEQLERFAVLVATHEREKQVDISALPIIIEAAVKEAVLAEREACAKVCEETELAFDIAVWCDSTKKEMTAHTANGLAAAIRARGEK